jgi:hypothetical protein
MFFILRGVGCLVTTVLERAEAAADAWYTEICFLQKQQAFNQASKY